MSQSPEPAWRPGGGWTLALVAPDPASSAAVAALRGIRLFVDYGRAAAIFAIGPDAIQNALDEAGLRPQTSVVPDVIPPADLIPVLRGVDAAVVAAGADGQVDDAIVDALLTARVVVVIVGAGKYRLGVDPILRCRAQTFDVSDALGQLSAWSDARARSERRRFTHA